MKRADQGDRRPVLEGTSAGERHHLVEVANAPAAGPEVWTGSVGPHDRIGVDALVRSVVGTDLAFGRDVAREPIEVPITEANGQARARHELRGNGMKRHDDARARHHEAVGEDDRDALGESGAGTTDIERSGSKIDRFAVGILDAVGIERKVRRANAHPEVRERSRQPQKAKRERSDGHGSGDRGADLDLVEIQIETIGERSGRERLPGDRRDRLPKTEVGLADPAQHDSSELIAHDRSHGGTVRSNRDTRPEVLDRGAQSGHRLEAHALTLSHDDGSGKRDSGDGLGRHRGGDDQTVLHESKALEAAEIRAGHVDGAQHDVAAEGRDLHRANLIPGDVRDEMAVQRSELDDESGCTVLDDRGRHLLSETLPLRQIAVHAGCTLVVACAFDGRHDRWNVLTLTAPGVEPAGHAELALVVAATVPAAEAGEAVAVLAERAVGVQTALDLRHVDGTGAIRAADGGEAEEQDRERVDEVTHGVPSFLSFQ